ncbi:hypothetical protein NDI37_08800 [Funiculus sociatus GB2-A5]|uniref:TRADD-like N-terminal domain-containing protein n=2 Tax=Funiculus TaxID=2886342 RepID=A0ABV0JMA6_9CYAN|nr:MULTISPECIES: hypothetical protein [unclassified Trichocoleus]MBD1904932.1 hypothetical protein [Trichocoleus sp. FACHB-832]MBD2064692.1 hypothetical protein [Trichocoleus sp. FACHB-6]
MTIEELTLSDMTIDELIKQAEDEWYTDRLKADLAEYKREYKASNRKLELSPKEYKCLCGLLCNYSPVEIATKLNNTKQSLREELSQGLYRYIKMLIEHKKGLSVEIQWFSIARHFDDLEYKKKPVEKFKWTLKINLEAFSKEEQEDILAKMKNVLDDYSIKLENINKGCILLTFSSSQQAFEQAKSLFEAGELPELLGVPILDVQAVNTKRIRTQEEQEEFANSLLRTCRREGYDWVEFSQILDILDAVQQAYLTRKEAIAAAIKELLSSNTLLADVSKSGDPEDSSNDAEEEDLYTEFINALNEEIIDFYRNT